MEGHFSIQEGFRVQADWAYRHRGKKWTDAFFPEEKGSDVNLGSHLLWDVFHGDCDRAMVITNDSDLVTPIKMAMGLGATVEIVNPHRKPAQALSAIGAPLLPLKRGTVRQCQLPDPVQGPSGPIAKPPEWA